MNNQNGFDDSFCETLKRVGESAKEAGVSLDELMNLVSWSSAASEKDKEMIRNSIKSMFQRLDA
jgi:hypothetical protein